MRRFLVEEHRRHPWMVPGLLWTGGAAFGSALPDILSFVVQVLS